MHHLGCKQYPREMLHFFWCRFFAFQASFFLNDEISLGQVVLFCEGML